MRRVIATITASLLCAILAPSAVAQSHGTMLEKLVSVDIPAQKVSTALIALSHQAGVQVLMPGKLVDSARAHGVKGRMSLSEALSRLLRGTHLAFHEVGDNAIGITDKPTKSALPPEGSTASPRMIGSRSPCH